MRQQQTRNELRCFCRRRPLLATYGLDTDGKLYVHVKVYKNRRIYGEILVTRGDIHLHCRECLRWHHIEIQPTGKAKLVETPEPESIGEDVSVDHV